MKIKISAFFVIFIFALAFLAHPLQAKPSGTSGYTITIRTDEKNEAKLCEALQEQGFDVVAVGEHEYQVTRSAAPESIPTPTAPSFWDNVKQQFSQIWSASRNYAPYLFLAIGLVLGVYLIYVVVIWLRRKSEDEFYVDEALDFEPRASQTLSAMNLSQRILNNQSACASPYVSPTTPVVQTHFVYPQFNQARQYSILRSSMTPRR